MKKILTFNVGIRTPLSRTRDRHINHSTKAVVKGHPENVFSRLKIMTGYKKG